MYSGEWGPAILSAGTVLHVLMLLTIVISFALFTRFKDQRPLNTCNYKNMIVLFIQTMCAISSYGLAWSVLQNNTPCIVWTLCLPILTSLVLSVTIHVTEILFRFELAAANSEKKLQKRSSRSESFFVRYGHMVLSTDILFRVNVLGCILMYILWGGFQLWIPRPTEFCPFDQRTPSLTTLIYLATALIVSLGVWDTWCAWRLRRFIQLDQLKFLLQFKIAAFSILAGNAFRLLWLQFYRESSAENFFNILSTTIGVTAVYTAITLGPVCVHFQLQRQHASLVALSSLPFASIFSISPLIEAFHQYLMAEFSCQ